MSPPRGARIVATAVIGGSILIGLIASPAGAHDVKFKKYKVVKVKATAVGGGKTEVTMDVEFQCDGAKKYSVQLGVYSVDEDKTYGAKKLSGSKPTLKYEKVLALKSGDYIVGSTNARCWDPDPVEGPGEHHLQVKADLRAWKTFHVA